MSMCRQEKTSQPLEEPITNVAPRTSRLRRLLARHRAVQLERRQQAEDLLTQRRARWELERRRQAQDLLARHRTRKLEPTQEQDYMLAGRVHDIFVGRGLVQNTYSIGGGRGMDVPQVISVTPGPPTGLKIRMLPGQTPDDFAAHSSAIAYNLNVAEVQIVPLGPSLIRLDLLRA